MGIERSLSYVFAQLKLLGLGEPRQRDDYLRERQPRRNMGRLVNPRNLERHDLREKLKASVKLCKKTTE